jgi:hypothetical protein
MIGGVKAAVKFADVYVTALRGGSLPISLPTNQEGNGEKPLQVGTYRVKVDQAGYGVQEKEVVLDTNGITVEFILEKFNALIYGTVKDGDFDVPDASITALSEYGDTLTTDTDANGSFSLDLPAGDWQVVAGKPGYHRSTEYNVSLLPRENKDMGTLIIDRYENVISGLVTNRVSGKPIINVMVVLDRNNIYQETDRTDNDGNYSFNIAAGAGYGLTFSREGFNTVVKDSIELTTNVTFNIALTSEIGMVNGITFVKSHFAAQDTFLESGRGGIVITAVDTASAETLGIAQSGRDFTYSLSLPAGVYHLHFTGENVIPAKLTGIQIIKDQILDTNIVLGEYARISGTIHALQGDTNYNVNVAALKAGLEVATVSSEKSSGSFTIPGLVSGDYTLRFAREGFQIDSAAITIRDTTIGTAAYFMSTVLPEDTLLAGDVTLRWQILLLGYGIDTTDSNHVIKLNSPLQRNFESDTFLTNLGAFDYRIGTNVYPDSVFPDSLFTDSSFLKVLDMDSMHVALAAGSDTTLTLSHPLKHYVQATADTLPGGDVELKLIIYGINYDTGHVSSATLFYRDQNEIPFQSSASYTFEGDSTLVFRITPTADNSSMKYYFEAVVDGVKYSNKGELFTTFVPASKSIKYVTVLPTAWEPNTPAILPWDNTVAFKIICQDGSFNAVDDSRYTVNWTAADQPGIITFTNRNAPVMTAAITKSDSINESRVDTVQCSVITDVGDTIVRTTYYAIAKLSVDTLFILGGTPEIYAGEKVSYMAVAANTGTGKQFATMGAWDVNPRSRQHYTISPAGGQLTSQENFMGTVRIRVTAFGITTVRSLSIKHYAKPADTSWAENRDGSFKLTVGPAVFPVLGQDFCLKTTAAADLPVRKSTNLEGQVVGSTYTLSFSTAKNTKAFDNFNFYIEIPGEFRGKDVFLGVWNQKQTIWEKVDSTYFVDDNLDIVTFRAAHPQLAKGKRNHAGSPEAATYLLARTMVLGSSDGPGSQGEYALLADSREFGIHHLRVGPNPFSPFVTAKDDNGASWQGLRIEFEVSSQRYIEVESEVQILNIQGNLVRDELESMQYTGGEFRRLYPLNTRGGFYGNQTIKRYYFWDGTNKNGRLCRNGRYFIKILVDDRVDKEYKTIPVVLFK